MDDQNATTTTQQAAGTTTAATGAAPAGQVDQAAIDAAVKKAQEAATAQATAEAKKIKPDVLKRWKEQLDGDPEALEQFRQIIGGAQLEESNKKVGELQKRLDDQERDRALDKLQVKYKFSDEQRELFAPFTELEQMEKLAKALEPKGKEDAGGGAAGGNDAAQLKTYSAEELQAMTPMQRAIHKAETEYGRKMKQGL